MRTLPVLTLLTLAVAPVVVAAATLQGDRGSLQDLLRGARTQREARQAVIEAEVASGLEALREAIAAGRTRDLADLRGRLVELGPASAEYLLPHLDPGPASTLVVEDGERRAGEPERLANNVVVVLRGVLSPAVTDDLLDLADTGSERAARNALKVLTATREPDRVVPRLERFLSSERGQDPTLRGEALQTLARLGGPEATEYLTEALGDENPDLVTAALRALVVTRNAEAGNAVLNLIVQPGSAIHLREILGYYRAVPELATGVHQQALIGLATRRTLPREAGASILDLLRDLDVAPDRKVKKLVEDLQDSPSRDLSEAAMAWLASRGERAARRRLLGPYDDFVDQNDDNPKAYEDRATVLYRIRDYDDALKDYREVIRLSRSAQRRSAAYTGAARCAAWLGKFKDAQDLLRRSPLSTQEIGRLASDPAFAEMIEKARYRKLFGLPEQDS